MRRHQDGYIWKKGGVWYGRWRENVMEGGQIKRKQRSGKLADYCDRYRNESDVRPLLEEKLRPINEGRANPQGAMSVADYYKHSFLPHAEGELKPSTVNGYKKNWKMYLSPSLPSVPMRDFRCVDATRLLETIHQKHGIGRMTLRHCKALLSSIFTHAKRNGVIDGMNPVIDAGIPRKAHRSKPTKAASAEHVMAMLNCLTGIARLAVALVYFGGLRPGEARGAKWVDYDGKVLLIRRSVWRTHLTDAKTEGSGTEDVAAPVPVCEPLRVMLDGVEKRGVYILESFRRKRLRHKPINLDNLAKRVIRPALLKKNIPWGGWYTLRRGIGTLATAVSQDKGLAAMGWLRHANIATTQGNYIKDVPPETQRAAEKVSQLFNGGGAVQ